MNKRALLLIDIQQDYFPSGAFPLSGMDAASKKAAALLTWARNQRMSVVHVRHEDLDPETTFLKAGSDGCTIHSRVAPTDGEAVITKNFPNAFRESSLSETLAGIDEVIISGAMSNMCVDATSRAAFDLGFEVTVIHDACAACELEFNGQSISDTQVHAAFMASLSAAYGAVMSSDELLAAG